MGRVQQQGGAHGSRCEHGASGNSANGSGASRRTFLGATLGCALPVVAGAGILKAHGVVATSQGRTMTDPVWEHLESEAWRTYREVKGPFGVTGEHVRRIGSHLDLFAVHLRGSGFDGALDGEVRQLLAERGSEGAALALIDRLGDASVTARTAQRASLDPAKVAASLDRLAAKGAVPTIREWRPGLERAAAMLDRQRQDAAGRLRTAAASTQKPGDDFQGLPDPPLTPENLCHMLEGLIVGCNILVAVLALAGVTAEVAAALEAVVAALGAVEYFCCRTVAA